jgi:hypothetical protein
MFEYIKKVRFEKIKERKTFWIFYQKFYSELPFGEVDVSKKKKAKKRQKNGKRNAPGQVGKKPGKELAKLIGKFKND